IIHSGHIRADDIEAVNLYQVAVLPYTAYAVDSILVGEHRVALQLVVHILTKDEGTFTRIHLALRLLDQLGLCRCYVSDGQLLAVTRSQVCSCGRTSRALDVRGLRRVPPPEQVSGSFPVDCTDMVAEYRGDLVVGQFNLVSVRDEYRVGGELVDRVGDVKVIALHQGNRIYIPVLAHRRRRTGLRYVDDLVVDYECGAVFC